MQINKDTLPYLTLDELHPDTEISNDDFNSYFVDIEKDINNNKLSILTVSKGFLYAHVCHFVT